MVKTPRTIRDGEDEKPLTLAMKIRSLFNLIGVLPEALDWLVGVGGPSVLVAAVLPDILQSGRRKADVDKHSLTGRPVCFSDGKGKVPSQKLISFR